MKTSLKMILRMRLLSRKVQLSINLRLTNRMHKILKNLIKYQVTNQNEKAIRDSQVNRNHRRTKVIISFLPPKHRNRKAEIMTMENMKMIMKTILNMKRKKQLSKSRGKEVGAVCLRPNKVLLRAYSCQIKNLKGTNWEKNLVLFRKRRTKWT